MQAQEEKLAAKKKQAEAGIEVIKQLVTSQQKMNHDMMITMANMVARFGSASASAIMTHRHQEHSCEQESVSSSPSATDLSLVTVKIFPDNTAPLTTSGNGQLSM